MWTLLLMLALADDPATDDPATDDAQVVTIPLGKSALVQLPAEARALSVTDHAVVRPAQLSPTLWQLQGVALGTTDVAIVHADGELELLDLHVQRDVSELVRTIDRIAAPEGAQPASAPPADPVEPKP